MRSNRLTAGQSWTVGVRRSREDRFLRAIAGVAIAQLAFAIAVFPFILPAVEHERWAFRLLLLAHAMAFGGAGLFLRWYGREARARVLGTVFLVVATGFAAGAVTPGGETSLGLREAFHAVLGIRLEPLTAYLVWVFARDFPFAPGSRRQGRWLDAAITGSLVLAACLIAVNIVVVTVPAWSMAVTRLAKYGVRSIHDVAVYGMAALAVAAVAYRARRAPVDERHRASLLGFGLLLGSAPSLIMLVLWSVAPSLEESIPLSVAGWIIYPALLSIPLTTAYAVIVRRALRLRVIVRTAVQYAVTRYAVLVLAALPFVFLVVTVYGRRTVRIADVFVGAQGAVLVALVAIALGSVYGRRRLLDVVDRAFFREQYDLRRATGLVIEACRAAVTRGELASAVRGGIDQALHPRHIELLFGDPLSESFGDAAGRLIALPKESRLGGMIRDNPRGLDADLSNPSLATLPEIERRWLADADARLLVPLRDADEQLVAIILVGEKRSELPFTSEDRDLIRGVGAAAELTIAYHRLQQGHSGTPPAPPAQSALECLWCSAVQGSASPDCSLCGGQLADTGLPEILAGKFKLEARIGAGGMGVVYRALDLDLRRRVALKTLPHTSILGSARLRHEARSMAAVVHQHVASIYGLESWRGQPILVVEFLPHGTLKDRLRRGPLPWNEAVTLGADLARGLGALHAAAMLHRDIKPSNIGFAAPDTAKLLDFGLAWTPGDTGEEPDFDPGAPGGTIAYLPREVLEGVAPTFDSDIWSLVLTLYEAIAGYNPVLAAGAAATRARILQSNIPNIREFVPDVPREMADWFVASLSRDASGRPRSARQLEKSLNEFARLSLVGV